MGKNKLKVDRCPNCQSKEIEFGIEEDFNDIECKEL